ncbi:hypothetical protein EJ02DRAFT_228601 [Clathrospora elynae]|uniref:Uncharacterized protein n=1 Tax=Clathrospora elynae TaxID=706981 RepID=A0A6A5SLY8_9PLEO|nr:hypothetical protein EJ02DRAFT_228601 [Clathrospora elynae]
MSLLLSFASLLLLPSPIHRFFSLLSVAASPPPSVPLPASPHLLPSFLPTSVSAFPTPHSSQLRPCSYCQLACYNKLCYRRWALPWRRVRLPSQPTSCPACTTVAVRDVTKQHVMILLTVPWRSAVDYWSLRAHFLCPCYIGACSTRT